MNIIIRTKRTVSAVLAAVVLLVTVCLPVSAAGGSFSGVDWRITDSVLTVSGGDIPDMTQSSAAPWRKFADGITSITVGEGVTRIGNRAFEGLSSVTSVTMKEVTVIGEKALSGCASLQELTVPEGVVFVGDFALAECTSLKALSLPSTLTSLGEGVLELTPALEEITSLSAAYPTVSGALVCSAASTLLRYPSRGKSLSVLVPDNIKKVAAGAFADCAVTSVTLSGVQEIGVGAFYGCASLREVDMPAVRAVSDAAFFGCSSLYSVKFPSSLLSLGDGAFKYCSSLARAEFAGDAPVLGDEVFLACGGGFTLIADPDGAGWGEGDSYMGYPLLLHGVYGGEDGGVFWELDTLTGVLSLWGEGEMPDYASPAHAPWYLLRRGVEEITVTGLSSVGDNAFRYTSATSACLDSSVLRVGEFAFSASPRLLRVDGAGVTTVESCAFFGCPVLDTVTLGRVSTFGDQCFSSCASLYAVYTANETAPALGKYAFDGTAATLVYPVGGNGYQQLTEVRTEAYLFGDADGDGKCSLSDVGLLMQFAAGWKVDPMRLSADANSDRRLTLLDASLIIKHIAGWL